MKDDRDHLVDISEALERIAKYAAHGRNSFERDELTQNWIVRHLSILCESCDALSPAFRSSYPTVPWIRLSSVGALLAEHYFDFDHDLIWKSITTDLPPLQQQIDRKSTRLNSS